jgi:hypothetical protein|eukprot:SAG25_NODE_1741_length_2413_cov_3.716012_3_plen_67_part_00
MRAGSECELGIRVEVDEIDPDQARDGRTTARPSIEAVAWDEAGNRLGICRTISAQVCEHTLHDEAG